MTPTTRNLSPRTWLTRARDARTELRGTRRDSGHVASVTTQLVEDLASQREEIHHLRTELTGVTQHLTGISQALTEQRQRLLLALRMVRDDDARARQELLDLRRSPDYHDAFDESEPLVSVVIPTYNNWVHVPRPVPPIGARAELPALGVPRRG